MSSHALQFAGNVFSVRSALLGATLADPYWCDQYNLGRGKGLSWHLTIETDPARIGDSAWKPSVYHESLTLTPSRWSELVGTCVEWSTAFDERTGAPNGGFYLHEHEDMPTGRIRFGPRVGHAFELTWQGTCNPHHSSELDENVPFHLTASAVFTGIIVNGTADEEDSALTARLGNLISLDDLKVDGVELQGKYNSGVRMKVVRLVPRI